MGALIRRRHADAVRFAWPAKIVRRKIANQDRRRLRKRCRELGTDRSGRAQTWRNLLQNKFATRELMAAVFGLVREGDQIRQPNCSMENVSGIRS
jgi:hypothetical protein